MIQPTLIKSVSYAQGNYTVTVDKSESYSYIDIQNEEGDALHFATCDFSLEAVIEALQTVKSLLDNQ